MNRGKKMDSDSEEVQACIDLRISIAEFRRNKLTPKERETIASDERAAIASLDRKPAKFYLL